ncbi:MAG: N-acetyltransferase [Gemmatimonadetes bacterium]|nr:N-acetyltransferase [Gemmatimonadota bacterium]
MNAVEHVPAEKRFVVRLESGEAELTYLERSGRVLDLFHTFVPPEARGQGVGEVLVERAFAHARENGNRIRASCPFVRNWLEDHPEQAEIVVSPA